MLMKGKRQIQFDLPPKGEPSKVSRKTGLSCPGGAVRKGARKLQGPDTSRSDRTIHGCQCM